MANRNDENSGSGKKGKPNSRHNSMGRIDRSSNRTDAESYNLETIDSDLYSKSFLSSKTFKNRLNEEGLETNLRDKNREIIYYLKEIDKL